MEQPLRVRGALLPAGLLHSVLCKLIYGHSEVLRLRRGTKEGKSASCNKDDLSRCHIDGCCSLGESELIQDSCAHMSAAIHAVRRMKLKTDPSL